MDTLNLPSAEAAKIGQRKRKSFRKATVLLNREHQSKTGIRGKEKNRSQKHKLTLKHIPHLVLVE